MYGQYRNNYGSNSLLYLALICLIYFLLSSYHIDLTAESLDTPNPRGEIYIEIVEGNYSTVLKIDAIQELNEIAEKYNIDNRLKNGYKVMLEGWKGTVSGRISGIKSMSLGVPIGINSAGIEDLTALPGIGDKLARRIAEYRVANGGIQNVSELLNVEGMGRKKLAAVKNLISLD